MRFAGRLCILSAIALAAGAGAAKADFIGQSFTPTYQYPTANAVYPSSSWTPPSFVVGAGVETVGSVEGVTTITVDFTGSSLSLTLATTLTNPTWTAVGFNGPVFTSPTALNLASVAVDSATNLAGFTASHVSFTNNELRIDWGGSSYTTGSKVVLDFTFAAVPEPATLGVLGIGLAGLGWVRRRRAGGAAAPL